jgi:hypothetical protein
MLGIGDIAPHILNLGTGCSWVVSVTPPPLYPRGNRPRMDESHSGSGPCGAENFCPCRESSSVSQIVHPDYESSKHRGERAPGTHWTGGSVGPRAGLDSVEKRRSRESLPLGSVPSLVSIIVLDRVFYNAQEIFNKKLLTSCSRTLRFMNYQPKVERPFFMVSFLFMTKIPLTKEVCFQVLPLGQSKIARVLHTWL